MKNLREACRAGEPIITVECPPPKGADTSLFIRRAKQLLGRVHAINVTDNQAAVMRASSVALCKVLLDMGHDPVYQITGRDRNRLGIQSDLLGAHILGIRNVLALTGDYVTVGDQKESKPVFDLESVHILQVIAGLNRGVDMAGHVLKGATALFPGGTVVLETNPLPPLLMKFEKKIKAGAQFFQTQAVFDLDRFEQFMRYAKGFNVTILAGILLLRSARMAHYVTQNIPGIKVPPVFIEALEKAGSREKEREVGLDIAVRILQGVRHLCNGVHVMAIGAEEDIPIILERAGLT